MAHLKNNVRLAAAIAAALGRHDSKRLNSTLAFGMAVCVVAQPAAALSLGELTVNSALGEPLAAEAVVTLRQGETLNSNCMASVANGDGGMSLPDKLTVSAPDTRTPGQHILRLGSRAPLYEPLYEIRLKVDCPGSVAFIRDYVVMLNLPMSVPISAPQPISEPRQAPVSRQPALPKTKPRSYTERFPTPTGTIAQEQYTVQPGDTLSTIAQRASTRVEQGLWAYADAIFAGNPDAFVAGDPNRIKLGAKIILPVSGSTADTPVSQPVAAATPSVQSVAPEQPVSPALPTTEAAQSEPAPQSAASGPIILVDRALLEEPPAPVPAIEQSEPDAAAAAPIPAPAVDTAQDSTTERGVPPLLSLAGGLLAGTLLALIFYAARAWRRRSVAFAAPDRTNEVAESPDEPEEEEWQPPVDEADLPEEAFVTEAPRVSLSDHIERPDTDDPEHEQAPEQAHEQENDYPSLNDTMAEELPVENTARFSAPDFSPEGEKPDWEHSELEGTSTMRKIFGDEAEEESAEGSEDLQSMADVVYTGASDERLSQTLSEALGLLEQDYENELSDSQILDQREIQDAFAAHRKDEPA